MICTRPQLLRLSWDYDTMMLNSRSSSPDYDVKLVWHQQGNDIVSLAAICTAMVDFLCLVVPDLLGCISYNMSCTL